MPGVAQLLRADQLSADSRDRTVRAAALSHVDGRGGDLLVVPKEYWSLLGRATNIANHGTPYEYDTHVPMIFMGGGIRAGRSGAAVTPADIAPTLASLAGMTMPRAEGRILREARR
jgi:arylsulfatase A-like enzyme